MSQGLIQAMQARAQAITASNPSRRDFLKLAASVSVAASGGLLIGFSLSSANAANGAAKNTTGKTAADAVAAPFMPNAFIEIDAQGQVTLIMPKVEMGQGVYTSLPMLIAEELEVSLAQVKLVDAPPNPKLYTDPLLGGQLTGGSTSIRYAWEPLRQAGAVCRTLLITAAAQAWKVDPATCQAENGEVIHVASGQKTSYGKLVDAAAKLPVPKSVSLKDPKDFKLIGTPAKRLDTPDKVNGQAKFGIDAQLPGMLYAVLATSPVFGGKLISVDDTRALKMPGVRQVVKLDNTVAVIADHTWAAKRGMAALDIQWDEGVHTHLTTVDLVNDLREAAKKPGAIAHQEGDTSKAMAGAVKTLNVVYQQPFLAHATMEPMNCTAHVRPDGCDLWVGSQVPTFAQGAAAKLTGLPLEKVQLHNHLIGGGFGRRLEVDNIVQAVRIAQQVNAPVKVIWTREEDIQHDMFRPYYYDHIAAGLNEKGMPVAWSHRIVGSSIMSRFFPPAVKNGVDPDAVEVSADLPYNVPNQYIDYVRLEPRDVPTAFWRGVGPTRGTFVVESFMDELAAAAKTDPVTYRRALLDKSPRVKAVLDLAASKSGWGNPLASGQGRGVSVMHAFGSFLSMVAEVTVNAQGEVRVNRVVCAVDCGMVVNPDTVKAQIEGGIIFGITAALYSEITLKNGRVEQNNFNDYRMLRMNESPVIEVYIVKSAEAPGGIGEPGTAALAPAVTNAIFAATGKRIRQLPVGAQLQTT